MLATLMTLPPPGAALRRSSRRPVITYGASTLTGGGEQHGGGHGARRRQAVGQRPTSRATNRRRHDRGPRLVHGHPASVSCPLPP